MKNIKKIGAVFLSSVIMSGFSSLFVSAEDFNNDLGGVNYNSIEELEYCQKNHKHTDIIRGMKSVYIPQVLKDCPEQIEKIMVTPWMISVDFLYDNREFSLEHWYAFDEKKIGVEKSLYSDPEYFPIIKKVNGNEILSYWFVDELKYDWVQNGELFRLRETTMAGRGRIINQEERNYFSLCNAYSLPLDLENAAEEPTFQKTMRVRLVDLQDRTVLKGAKVEVSRTEKGKDFLIFRGITDDKGEVQTKKKLDGSELNIKITYRNKKGEFIVKNVTIVPEKEGYNRYTIPCDTGEKRKVIKR